MTPIPEPASESTYIAASKWGWAAQRHNHRAFRAELRRHPMLTGCLALACIALGGAMIGLGVSVRLPARGLAVVPSLIGLYLGITLLGSQAASAERER